MAKIPLSSQGSPSQGPSYQTGGGAAGRLTVSTPGGGSGGGRGPGGMTLPGQMIDAAAATAGLRAKGQAMANIGHGLDQALSSTGNRLLKLEMDRQTQISGNALMGYENEYKRGFQSYAEPLQANPGVQPANTWWSQWNEGHEPGLRDMILEKAKAEGNEHLVPELTRRFDYLRVRHQDQLERARTSYQLNKAHSDAAHVRQESLARGAMTGDFDDYFGALNEQRMHKLIGEEQHKQLGQVGLKAMDDYENRAKIEIDTLGTGKQYVDGLRQQYEEQKNIPRIKSEFKVSPNTRDQFDDSSSTPGNRKISLDHNHPGSNKVAHGVEVVIPSDATPEERQAAETYAKETQAFFQKHGHDVPLRGDGGVKVQGGGQRGVPGYFHTEPFFGTDTKAREIIEQNAGEYAEILGRTLGKIKGATFIPPHKSDDPGATVGGVNERDFAKQYIIPELEKRVGGMIPASAAKELVTLEEVERAEKMWQAAFTKHQFEEASEWAEILSEAQEAAIEAGMIPGTSGYNVGIGLQILGNYDGVHERIRNSQYLTPEMKQGLIEAIDGKPQDWDRFQFLEMQVDQYQKPPGVEPGMDLRAAQLRAEIATLGNKDLQDLLTVKMDGKTEFDARSSLLKRAENILMAGFDLYAENGTPESPEEWSEYYGLVSQVQQFLYETPGVTREQYDAFLQDLMEENNVWSDPDELQQRAQAINRKRGNGSAYMQNKKYGPRDITTNDGVTHRGVTPEEAQQLHDNANSAIDQYIQQD